MNEQIITSPTGERLVVIPEAEYRALVAAAEDASDRVAVAAFRERMASGEEELVPADIVNRILNGENPIRAWREYRKMKAGDLAKAAGIAQPFLSQIETGKREGSVDVLRKIAKALHVTLDDIVG